jgi:tripartite-type tricarboxylate transporter receptor subunit TctC
MIACEQPLERKTRVGLEPYGRYAMTMSYSHVRWKSVRWAASAAVLWCVLTHGVQASESFASKTVTMMIPSGAGDGTDSTARLTGRHLAKYLPGQPTFIYMNAPGGGLGNGIKVLNEFVMRAPPDGLTIVTGSASNLDPTNLRNPAVRYAPKELRMVGGFPAGNAPLILRKDSASRLTDRSQKPVIMGNVNGVRNVDQMAVWGPEYLGWNIRWVVGYKGTAEVALAAIRGEIDMFCTWDIPLITQAMTTGDFMFPVQTGTMQNGKFVGGKGAEYRGVPIFSDLIKPLLRTNEDKQAFAVWEALAQISKWFALPPKTPDGILKIYRDAFNKAVKDEEFIVDAKKIMGDNFLVTSGEDMQRITLVADRATDGDLAYFDELREKVGIRIQR